MTAAKLIFWARIALPLALTLIVWAVDFSHPPFATLPVLNISYYRWGIIRALQLCRLHTDWVKLRLDFCGFLSLYCSCFLTSCQLFFSQVNKSFSAFFADILDASLKFIMFDFGQAMLFTIADISK